MNHAVSMRAMVRDGRIVGARVADGVSGLRTDVRASVVVNATGPWSDAVRSLDPTAESASGAKAMRGSKGVHIAVPRERSAIVKH